ncbi:hypothetical protein AUEXF2481DRAFT_700512 [Aureobasidium subglaciale EXF-2481]|uniref:BTB domain-containing protein n=1 Tax=Aureobasidium subglaciale (strain EXF-2481) TaxID=1043005 RepID=A0A074Y4M9_AURSE|nr:uncharacterized protein AUEXF2481DRAFT_700512 [Aureobasidium subglaciale EXF-2481]KEQ92743.1 hypothetical protein AUEXF2481DRAFT_700512 [Aureobasidium subglaciale EXF-2481]
MSAPSGESRRITEMHTRARPYSKDTLCAGSKYFDRALSGPFLEAKTHRIELDDISVFYYPKARLDQELRTLLEEERINKGYTPEELEEKPAYPFDVKDPSSWLELNLIDLYILGDRLDAPRFRAKIVDAIARQGPPNIVHIMYLYANLVGRSPLHRLFVHQVAYDQAWARRKKSSEHLLVEFLCDIMTTMGRRLPHRLCKPCHVEGKRANMLNSRNIDDACKEQDIPPYDLDMCFYHEHKDGDEK